jgi:hypothetical protein
MLKYVQNTFGLNILSVKNLSSLSLYWSASLFSIVIHRPLLLQSTQSDGPVRFLIFCSISIILLASLVAGRRSQYTVLLVQISRERTPPDLSTRISNLLQPAQAEVVLGQLSRYLASWTTTAQCSAAVRLYVLSDCLLRGCVYTITSAQYSAVVVSVSFLQRDSERLQSRHGGHQANLLQRQRLMKFTLIDKNVAISWHPIRRVTVTVLSLHIKFKLFYFYF